MSELISAAPSLSPRLSWLRHHGLTLTRTSDRWWRCAGHGKTKGSGPTQDDATASFAVKAGILHYSQDGWEACLPFEEEKIKVTWKVRALGWKRVAEELNGALAKAYQHCDDKPNALLEYERAKEELA